MNALPSYAAPSYASIVEGTELAGRTVTVTRADLVRYAGASGDFNPIHWSQRTAQAVGLPDVIAHGMWTMAQAGRLVSDWAGDPGALREFGVRFTRPVVVPDDDTGASVELTGKVSKLLPDNQVQVTLTVKYNNQTVLGKAQATVQLAP